MPGGWVGWHAFGVGMTLPSQVPKSQVPKSQKTQVPKSQVPFYVPERVCVFPLPRWEGMQALTLFGGKKSVRE